MQKKETILFAPLNWGLGHATRDVPLISSFLKKGHKIIIAADGAPLEFLKLEFPGLEFIIFSGFKTRYAPKPFFLLYLFLQMPFFYVSIWIEHLRLKKIIKDFQITTVVSDNRYGLWNKHVKSILITHQLFIQLPKLLKFLEPALHLITQKLIVRFTECWIPDYKEVEKSLTGKLSHGAYLPENAKYIGPLSRFANYLPKNTHPTKQNYPNVLILISGPEPQRTFFEAEMEAQFSNSTKTVLMVCGTPNPNRHKLQKSKSNITKVAHLSTQELYLNLINANTIIARSGYSTIMDLHVLGLKAVLIPTPNQSEQEYLAEWKNNTKASLKNCIEMAYSVKKRDRHFETVQKI